MAGAPSSSSSSKARWIRIGILVAITVGTFVALKTSGTLDDFDAERVRRQIDDAGIWGVLSFVAMFAFGELVHIPGMVFVGAAILAYGRALGFAIGLGGAIISVTISFILVRAVGGKALTEIDRPIVKRILERLDDRPVVTVIILRSILWLAPPLNYALALSNIKFRHYLIGSAVGLVVPVLAASLLFDWLFA